MLGVILGLSAALGAAFTYGTLALIARKIVNDYASPIVATSFPMMFGTLILVALFQYNAHADIGAFPRSGLMPLALAGVAFTLGRVLLLPGHERGSGGAGVTPLTGVRPLVAILLTHISLQWLERVTWRTVLAARIVVVGVVLIAVGNS